MSIHATILTVSLTCSFACFAATEGGGKTTQTQALTAAPGSKAKPSAPIAGSTPYKVVNSNKVDPNTLKGWKTWRAQACDRCHGAAQQGLVGPSLINSLKTLTKEEFMVTLKNGRIEKGMPNFGGIPNVVDNLDNLYAYLKGRSDGAIAAGRLEAIEK